MIHSRRLETQVQREQRYGLRLERNDKSERYLVSGMTEGGRGMNDAQVSRLGS